MKDSLFQEVAKKIYEYHPVEDDEPYVKFSEKKEDLLHPFARRGVRDNKR